MEFSNVRIKEFGDLADGGGTKGIASCERGQNLFHSARTNAGEEHFQDGLIEVGRSPGVGL